MMMTEEVLVIGNITPQMVERCAPAFNLHYLEAQSDPDQWLQQNGALFKALVLTRPNLKIIACNGVGYDAVDVAAAIKRRIIVTHTPDLPNEDVANTVIMLMLATSRALIQDDAFIRSGAWPDYEGRRPFTRSIEGKSVGLVGLGRIGLRLAKKLEMFNCAIKYHTRNRRDVPYTYYESLVSMAHDVDYLIVLTPGGEATQNLVNRDVINALGPEGTLINVARGSVVDEAELIAALQERRLGFAGLDVFAQEPCVPESLRVMDNVVLTPHIASATTETCQATGNLTIDNLLSYFRDGTALTPIPECKGYVISRF